MGVNYFFYTIIVHEEILQLVFCKLYLKLCVMLSFFVEIDHFAHDVILDLIKWHITLFFVFFDLPEHLFESQEVKGSFFEGKFDDFEHDNQEVI